MSVWWLCLEEGPSVKLKGLQMSEDNTAVVWIESKVTQNS